jgi:hypothetical protein
MSANKNNIDVDRLNTELNELYKKSGDAILIARTMKGDFKFENGSFIKIPENNSLEYSLQGNSFKHTLVPTEPGEEPITPEEKRTWIPIDKILEEGKYEPKIIFENPEIKSHLENLQVELDKMREDNKNILLEEMKINRQVTTNENLISFKDIDRSTNSEFELRYKTENFIYKWLARNAKKPAIAKGIKGDLTEYAIIEACTILRALTDLGFLKEPIIVEDYWKLGIYYRPNPEEGIDLQFDILYNHQKIANGYWIELNNYLFITPANNS